MEKLYNFTIKVTEPEFIGRIRNMSHYKPLEEVVEANKEGIDQIENPELSSFLLRAKNIDKARHMRIIVANESPLCFHDVVTKNKNYVEIKEWEPYVLESNRAGIIYDYAFSFYEFADMNALTQAFLKLELNQPFDGVYAELFAALMPVGEERQSVLTKSRKLLDPTE